MTGMVSVDGISVQRIMLMELLHSIMKGLK